MLNIIAISASMNKGGAENVMARLLNNFNKNKYNIELGLIRHEGVLLKELSNDIKTFSFGDKRALFSISSIRKTIKEKQPDIIFLKKGLLQCLR